MRRKIENKRFDEERALYNLKNANVINCVFAGASDGESILKEAKEIAIKNCKFSLRYPIWHVEKFEIEDSTMDSLTRAAIWYSHNGKIKNTRLEGIKAVRECSNIHLDKCEISSMEFGWKSHGITLENSSIESEYLFFDSKDIKLNNVKMKGKYSFQYMENLEIENSSLDTKDAFWHSKNVIVRNSIVKGEYLGWFSEGLTLENCKIIGTQPLCYCENLKLINCTMEGADLSFEYSDVHADVKGHVISIKNPKSGRIVVDSVGEIVNDEQVMECKGEVIIRNDLGCNISPHRTKYESSDKQKLRRQA